MAKTQGGRRFFTTTEVARYCEVSNDGVLKWIKAGKLRAFATPGGHYRIGAEDFREFLKLYAFPIQEGFFGASEKRGPAAHVLIVNEEAGRRAALIRRLRQSDPNWIVEEAGDGFEAGIKIGMTRPDVVVLDLKIPRIDALSLCRTIRANPDTHSIRILVIFSDPDEQARTHAMQAGADRCLMKPVEFESFRTEISRLLGRTPRRRAQPQQRV